MQIFRSQADFEHLMQLVFWEVTNDKYAFFVSAPFHAELRQKYGRSLPIMQCRRMFVPTSYLMFKNNMLVNQVDDVLNRFTEAGIEKHIQDYFDWLTVKPHVEEVIDTRRILSMSDLEFGFVIWLVVCSASLVVFIYEINSLRLRRKMRTLIGLFDFLKLLRARMSDYHDTW
jgi:hypothetical protein